MDDSWDPDEAARFPGILGECVYASRLLGRDPDLVLHGGGNSSVKETVADVTGRPVEVLHVKGSGWDMASIEPAGFAPLRLARLRELLEVAHLSDHQVVDELRCALTDSTAPNPSVESLLHALLPQRAVLHSHADAVVTLTDQPDGEALAHEVWGDAVVVVPYVMPGFALARACARLWPERSSVGTQGMVLLNHGLVTFGDSVQEAYEQHLQLVGRARTWLARGAVHHPDQGTEPLPRIDPGELAALRAEISACAGSPVVVSRHTDARTRAYVRREDLASVAARGPATPDHVLRTKRVPQLGRDVAAYARGYRAYFERNSARTDRWLVMLDPAPRVVLDPELGMLAVGRGATEADVVRDIAWHTMDVVSHGTALGEYQPVGEADAFDVEYWELEQAKLRLRGRPAAMAGTVALVTGAASGIGRACADALMRAGASVVGLDRSPVVGAAFEGPEWLGLTVDVTDRDGVRSALEQGVERFGGVDITVVAAGALAASAPTAELDTVAWRTTMAVDVDAVAALLADVHPVLRHAVGGGRLVLVIPRSVTAPGPDAAAYSASEAAITQLALVAGLEWAGDGIRVNVVHPDAAVDTGLWTPELFAERAGRYGPTEEENRRGDLLSTEVTIAAAAEMVLAMCGPAFAATTGAQVPVGGGNERVV